MYGHIEHKGDDSDVSKVQSERRLQTPQNDMWQFNDSNDIPFTNPFSPPPGAVTAYGSSYYIKRLSDYAVPNLRLGNLPMSSAILANGYPPSIQC